MTNQSRYNLVDIVQLVGRRLRFILIIALIGGVLGLVAGLLRKKQYTATSEFFVSSPFFSDRNNIFHTSNQTAAFVGYFGGDEDIDRIIGISNTTTFLREVGLRSRLDSFYSLKQDKPADMEKLQGIVKSGMNLKRNEYGLLQLSFTMQSPEVAASAADTAVSILDEIYTGFHTDLRGNVMGELQHKIQEADSAIASLTDTLGRLRDQYGIYEILSPARQNLIVSNSGSGNKAAGYGHALEQVQNIEAVKDQLVTDRARYESIINEYNTTGNAPAIHMIRVISQAKTPLKPSSPGPVVLAVLCAVIGGALAMLWVILYPFTTSFDGRGRQGTL